MGSMSRARGVAIISAVAGMTGLAVSLAATPAAAQTDPVVTTEQTFTENVTVDLTNEVQVSITKELSIVKDLVFEGEVHISGSIDDISKAAFALLDDKQLIDNSSATTSDANEGAIYGIEGLAGNIQLNAGTGALINQHNGGAISDAAGPGRASIDAEIFKLQNIFGNTVTQSPGPGGRDGYDNYAGVYDLGGMVGNIQANAGAGSVIQQTNAFSIASASDTVLAEATAAVLQEISGNEIRHNGTRNYAGIWNIGGLSGNIQVNAASGSAINQANVMPIAHSSSDG